MNSDTIKISETEIKLIDKHNSISIPILFQVNPSESRYQIAGTAFLIQYAKFGKIGYFIITAAHVLKEIDGEFYDNRFIGLQTKAGSDIRYVISLNDENVRESWLLNEKSDYAVLQVVPDSDFFNNTIHHFFNTNTLEIVEINSESEVLLLGFGDGLMSKDRKTDHFIWLATHTNKNKTRITKIDQETRYIEIDGDAIDGFSGSPILVKKKDDNENYRLYIVGVITHHLPIEDEEVGYYERLNQIKGGFGFDFNVIWIEAKECMKSEKFDSSGIKLDSTQCMAVEVKQIDEREFEMIF